MKHNTQISIRLLLGLFIVSLPAHSASATLSHPALAKVAHYLNHMTTLDAELIQTNPDGSPAEGHLTLKMPYRIKLTYTTPKPLVLLVIDAQTLVHYDPQTRGKTFHSFKGTPLEILMRRPFVLDKTLDVLDVSQGQGILKVTLAHAQAQDQGTLTLVFNEHPFQLRAWQVLDVQHNLTSVALVNIQEHLPLEDHVFRLPQAPKR